MCRGFKTSNWCYIYGNMLFYWRRKVQQLMQRLYNLPHVTRKWLQWKYYLFILTMKAIFYNEFLNLGYTLDVMMEPMVWIVDHFTKVLGPILVGGVITLTSSIVAIVYIIGLPYYWQKSPILTCFLIVLGNWILINVTFHFIMAAITDPGTPPEGILISEAVSVCKKCIAPKSPRTHHCSVCNQCILKMDHHCRTVFIMVLGFEIAYKEIWLGGEMGGGLSDALDYVMEDNNPHQEEKLEGYPVRVNGTHLIPVIFLEKSLSMFSQYGGTVGSPLLLEPSEEETEKERRNYWYRFSIMYTGMLTTGVFFSLGGLSIWHGRLISRGETSIEAHINKKETERLFKISQVYKNPYDFEVSENWKLFLGLIHGRGLRHILLPSRHPPIGNGLTWPNAIVSAASHNKVA